MQALFILLTIPVMLLLFGLYVDGITRWMRRYHRAFFGTLAVAALVAACLQWRAQGDFTVQVVLNAVQALGYGLAAAVGQRWEPLDRCDSAP